MENFKTITIGGLSKEVLLEKLIAANIQFNEYAKTLFKHAHFDSNEQLTEVGLVKIKLSDLSLKNPCSYQVIVDEALKLGLKLCPLYLGAFLRLEHMDQPEGPYLTVASLQPEEDESYPMGLYVRNFENSLWLRGYRVSGEAQWPAENEFIFLK